VVNTLVRNRVYPDPYFGTNLRSISGVTYPIAENFSNIPMPPASPFRHSWWCRTNFRMPEEFRGKTVWLHFDGINFRANVWLNGRQIASADKMTGPYEYVAPSYWLLDKPRGGAHGFNTETGPGPAVPPLG